MHISRNSCWLSPDLVLSFSKAQQQLLEAERMFDKMLSFGCTVAPVTATDDIGDGGVDGSASHYQVQMELTTALARYEVG